MKSADADRVGDFKVRGVTMPGYKLIAAVLLVHAAFVGLGIGPQTLGTGALTFGLCIAGSTCIIADAIIRSRK